MKSLGHMKYVTAGSLLGLVLGAGLGTLLHGTPTQDSWAHLARVVGTLWVNSLRMTIIPLVISLIITAVASPADSRQVGRMGGVSAGIFLGLLAAASAFVLLLVPPTLRGFHVDPGLVAALRNSVSGGMPDTSTPPTFTGWLLSLVPTNVFRAAANDELLPLFVFALLFALATTRVAGPARETVVAFFRGVGDAMFVLIRWLLLGMPVGVFALSLVFAAESGLALAGAVGYYLLVVCAVLASFTLVLYALAWGVGRVPLKRFAEALMPAQLVGISSRSSLASLPALMEGADDSLGMAPEVSGFVLPLAVSTLKVSTIMSNIVMLLFLAVMFGMPLTRAQVGTFVLTMFLLSFSAPGLPTGTTMRHLPVFLAMGIPIEGYLLLHAVEALPDIFKTVLNVTANLTVATLVARFLGLRAVTPRGDAAGVIETLVAPEARL